MSVLPYICIKILRPDEQDVISSGWWGSLLSRLTAASRLDHMCVLPVRKLKPKRESSCGEAACRFHFVQETPGLGHAGIHRPGGRAKGKTPRRGWWSKTQGGGSISLTPPPGASLPLGPPRRLHVSSPFSPCAHILSHSSHQPALCCSPGFLVPLFLGSLRQDSPPPWSGPDAPRPHWPPFVL